MVSASLTPEEFRRALGHFATGVSVVTVEQTPAPGEGRVRGMTANSFASVSLDPLLILICVDRKAKILPLLRERRPFGVSILSSEQQALSRYFATGEQSLSAEARHGIRYRWTASGIPLLEESIAQIACHVEAIHPAGDHTVFIGRVESAEIHRGDPLLFFRGKYRRFELRS